MQVKMAQLLLCFGDFSSGSIDYTTITTTKYSYIQVVQWITAQKVEVASQVQILVSFVVLICIKMSL